MTKRPPKVGNYRDQRQPRDGVIQGPPEIVAERLLQFLTRNKFV